MTARSEMILKDALSLPEEERSEIAIALWDSTRTFDDGDDGEDDPGTEAAWDEEIDRRIAEIDSGKVVGLTRAEMRAKLKAKFPWLR